MIVRRAAQNARGQTTEKARFTDERKQGKQLSAGTRRAYDQPGGRFKYAQIRENPLRTIERLTARPFLAEAPPLIRYLLEDGAVSL